MKLKNEEVVVDRDTGEIQTTIKTFNIRTNSAQFFMTFIDSISGLFNISNNTDRRVLDQLCKRVQFNSSLVYLTANRRKEITEELGISKQSLSNSLSNLKKLKIVSGEGGEYELNPFIFWKGTTDEREKILKDKGLELRLKFTLTD